MLRKSSAAAKREDEAQCYNGYSHGRQAMYGLPIIWFSGYFVLRIIDTSPFPSAEFLCSTDLFHAALFVIF